MTPVEFAELKVAIANLELELAKKSEELAKMKQDLSATETEEMAPMVKATFAAAAAAVAVAGEPEQCLDFPPIREEKVPVVQEPQEVPVVQEPQEVPAFPVLEIPEGSETCHVDGCHHIVYPCRHPDGNPVVDKNGNQILRMIKGQPVCSAHAPKCSNKGCHVFKGGPAACRFNCHRKSFDMYCPHCA